MSTPFLSLLAAWPSASRFLASACPDSPEPCVVRERPTVAPDPKKGYTETIFLIREESAGASRTRRSKDKKMAPEDVWNPSVASCWRKHFPGASHGHRYVYAVDEVRAGRVYLTRTETSTGATLTVVEKLADFAALYSPEGSAYVNPRSDKKTA